MAFYVIVDGSVKIDIKNLKGVVLGTNDSFGETSFYDSGKREGTATALEDTHCMSFSRHDIQKVLGNNLASIAYFNIQKWALKKSKPFHSYSNQELDRIGAEFKIKHAKAHEVILDANSSPDRFVLCLEGTINNEATGKMFGEEYFMNRELKLQSNVYKNNPGLYSTLNFTTADALLSKISDKRKRNSRISV